MTNSQMALAVTLAATLILGFPAGGTDKVEVAFELQCPGISIIVVPAGQVTLSEAQRLAKCMGDQSAICTVQTIRLTRKNLQK